MAGLFLMEVGVRSVGFNTSHILINIEKIVTHPFCDSVNLQPDTCP